MKIASLLGYVALCSAVLPLHAANITWTGSAGDGSFATGSNWAGGVPPASNDYQDTAVFGSGATPGAVNVPASRSLFGMRFDTAGWSLGGSAFADLRNVTSAGAGTNTVAQSFNQKYSGTWSVGAGNTLSIGSGFYQRSYDVTLAGGGTVASGTLFNGYSGTVGTWGVHIKDATLKISAATPYTSSCAGAVFLENAAARLRLLTSATAAQALIGTRIVDGLGLGLQVADVGGGYVEVSPISDPTPPMPGNWTLTLRDEFTGTSLDGTKWRLGEHWSGMAGSGGMAPENVTVNGGTLKIKSEQRSVSYGGTTYAYATGEVSTFFQYRQQYGYFEARVKYPGVTGLWPAFWFMPDRGQYGTTSGYYRSYLKFDLTGVNPGTITSAELRLKVSAIETATNNLVLMKLPGDSWSESTITWNNKPVPDPVWITQKWNNTTAVGSDITFDVTNYVTQQMAGDKKVGFVAADTFMRTKGIHFYSRETANQADRPRLIINGVTYYATEDAYVQWGANANTNFGSATELVVRDDWGDTANTFNGGMEIDTMESLGIWGANKTQHAVHWDGYGTQHQTTGWPNVITPTVGDGFHTYGVYWQPGMLEFYVDGARTATWNNTRVMSVPAYLILSLQLGGWDNNNPGAQDNNQTMEVDWVRAWSGTRTGLTGVVADNSDTTQVVTTGSWTASTATAGYYGANYVNDANTGKGTKTFSFKPSITASGTYNVYGLWTSGTNRATNVPIDVIKADGSTATVTVNQQANGSQWNLLGTYSLAPANAEIRIRTDSTNGFVIADAIRLVPTP